MGVGNNVWWGEGVRWGRLSLKATYPGPKEGEDEGMKEGAMISPISPSLSLFICVLLLCLLCLSLLLVDVLAADDLVNDPVENVKNEEDEREGHAGHGVDALGAADEQLLHLLDALLGCGRGRSVVVVALDGHSILGLQAGGAHAVAREAEAALARLVLLQNR